MLVVGLARELITRGFVLNLEISLESHSIEIRRYLDFELGILFSGIPGRNKLDGVDIIEAHVEFVRKSERELNFGSVRIWTGRPLSL